jgi:hypothetical protein
MWRPVSREAAASVWFLLIVLRLPWGGVTISLGGRGQGYPHMAHSFQQPLGCNYIPKLHFPLYMFLIHIDQKICGGPYVHYLKYAKLEIII